MTDRFNSCCTKANANNASCANSFTLSKPDLPVITDSVSSFAASKKYYGLNAFLLAKYAIM